MTVAAFLLVPELHLLDLAGPAQVFSTAADLGYGYELRYVAERADVPTAQGIPLRADTTWPELTPNDLLIVPGWRTSLTRSPPARPAAAPSAAPSSVGAASASAVGGNGTPRAGAAGARWSSAHSSATEPGCGPASLPTPTPIGAATVRRLAEHHQRGGTVASVCAGADALGRAGLLDGRRCTTHHELQDELARRYPRSSVVRDVLYIVDGRVVTSAGIASGIDLALFLLATRHGPAAAARVARSMVVYARRNGDDHQASVLLRHRAHLSDAVHRVQDQIDARFAEPLLLSELAASAGVSERTLTRRFTAATRLTPLRYQQMLRLERAQHLIESGGTVESAARAVGFTDARMLRKLRHRPVDTDRPD